MHTPETPETFRAICAYWAKIIKTKGENGVHIWIPCESPIYRVRQLLDNTKLQHEMIDSVNPKLLLIDGYEQEAPSFEEIQNQIRESLGYTTEDAFALERWLSHQGGQPLVIFLTGFDNALRHNNTLALQRIASLPGRYTNYNFKVILLTELNIPESENYFVLLRSSNLLQNVYYQPVFQEKDILQFIAFIAEDWNMTIPQKLQRVLVEDIGGHFLLIKEGIRLMRDNPKITREEILAAPSMERKGVAIFERLSERDRQTVVGILQKEHVNSISEYLSATGLVVKGKGGLAYWEHIRHLLLPSETRPISPSSYSLEYYLTSMERDVLDLLTETKGIVSREQIAEKIWHKSWEDKYSDWAIDQLVHRLREKLTLTKSQYGIQTRKRQGFILITRDWIPQA